MVAPEHQGKTVIVVGPVVSRRMMSKQLKLAQVSLRMGEHQLQLEVAGWAVLIEVGLTERVQLQQQELDPVIRWEQQGKQPE